MRSHELAAERRSRLRRARLFRLNRLFVALLLVLVATLPVTWAGGGPAGADSGTEPPAKPAELRVVPQMGLLNVMVDWDDVDDASEYWVRWRSLDSGEKLNEGVKVPASNIVIRLADFGEWRVRVQACNDAGCGQPQVQDFEVVPVPAPTELEVATEEGSLDVSLDWDDVDGASEYWVRWRVAGPGNELNE